MVKTAETPLQYVESPAMTFSYKYRNYTAQKRAAMEFAASMESKEKPSTAPQTNANIKKKMKWGEPTWFLFHTLAEKIKPEHFQEVRADLLNIIFVICTNLPCPDCARHATSYMNAINFNTITTKDSLRLLLHRFHNEVNKRKGLPEFPLDELSPKYSVANTVNVIHYFMPFFEDKHASIRMIADDMHRARVALQLKAWFNKNIGFFDL